MKNSTKNRLYLPAILTSLAVITAGSARAQTPPVLHNFSNGDGTFPYASLILSGNTLFGTTAQGGTERYGTVFAMKIDGTGFTNLHNFSGFSDTGITTTNTDGGYPYGGLVLSGSTLYGATAGGGTSVVGMVFAINTDGTGFTNLHSFSDVQYPYFTNQDGLRPYAELVVSGSRLYGTTTQGGSRTGGTVFALNTDGRDFTTLHSFGGGDGAGPHAGLIISGTTLYGTTSGGSGTVFALQTDGTGFTNLYNFTATTAYPGPYTNSDGAKPSASMVLSDDSNTLYGVTTGGGSSGNGTIFAIQTDGTGFTNLYNFTATPPYPEPYTNRDGAIPYGRLILSGHTLYGTTTRGGSSGGGTVFAIHTNGIGMTTLYSFAGGPSSTNGAYPHGEYPYAGLILTNTTLYGTTTEGGAFGGTIFSLPLGPELTISPSGADVVLTWATNFNGFIYEGVYYDGFTLQSATSLFSPTAWSTVSSVPVVVNGQNTVTDTIADPQRFYQLSPPPCWPPPTGSGYRCVNGVWTK